jgi:hypothetical protein
VFFSFCGLTVLVGGLILAFLYHWLEKPGRQIPTDRIITNRSLAYLRLDDLTLDPGAQEFARELLTRIQEVDRHVSASRVPTWLSLFIRSSEPSIRDLSLLIPQEATLVLELLKPEGETRSFEREPEREPVPNDPEVGILAAVNPRAFTRVLELLTVFEVPIEDEAGCRYYEIFDLAYAPFHHTLLIADSPRLICRAQDHLGQGGQAALSARIKRPLLPGEWDLHGRVNAENMEFLYKEMATIVAAGFVADIHSSDSVLAEVTIVATNAEAAAIFELEILRGLKELSAEGFELSVDESERRGEKLTIRMKLLGIDGLIRDFAAGMEESLRKDRSAETGTT